MKRLPFEKKIGLMRRECFLERFVWRRTERLEVASDFAQETLMRMWRMDPEEFSDEKAVETAAVTVLFNLMRDSLRQDARRGLEYGELADDREDVPHRNHDHTWPDSAAHLDQLLEIVERGAQQLPPKQREAVRRKLEGDKPTEAARSVGANPRTHKKHLFKAIRSMRTYLSEAGYVWPSSSSKERPR